MTTSENFLANTSANMATTEFESTLRDRLLRLGCYLFNIYHPDGPKRGSIGAYVRALIYIGWVVASLFLMFTLSDHFPAEIHSVLHRLGLESGNQAVDRSITLLGVSAVWTILFICVQSQIQQTIYLRTSDTLILERERAKRQEAESTLRLLKAQIEPHFLFNTLGAVQHLAEDKAPEAAALTADLILFLRATLSSLRADNNTLAEDLAVCEAYLHIMQTRLSRRLAFNIDCPPNLQSLRLPSALLLTLVENAVKHGIERAPDGGRIDITAHQDGKFVQIRVADTGFGFTESIGQGLGLQHVRDRLALAYGADAELTLEENDPRGVVAQLRLPLTNALSI